jgi:Flp pilus assembly protein TadD
MGRFDEAMAEAQLAQRLDPLSPLLNIYLAQQHMINGEVDAAMEAATKTLELDPAFAETHRTLGVFYRRTGRYSEAIAAFEKALELSARQSFALADLGLCYVVAGKKAKAQAILQELEEKYYKHEALGQNIANVYAALGERDLAFTWLEKDFQARSGFLPNIVHGGEHFEIMREKLSSDPRWSDLLRRIGLPQN